MLACFRLYLVYDMPLKLKTNPVSPFPSFNKCKYNNEQKRQDVLCCCNSNAGRQTSQYINTCMSSHYKYIKKNKAGEGGGERGKGQDSLRRCYLRRGQNKMRTWTTKIFWGDSTGNSKCKGPKAGTHLTCSKNSKRPWCMEQGEQEGM